jgi:tetratricopeptide (TPR) repeat protein
MPLRDELKSAHERLAERKVIERAKGILMKQKGIAEDDAFRLMRDLAKTLRAAVAPASAAAPETEVVEAYEAFSRGVLNRSAETFESLDRAVLLFERAVRVDPSYARAHAELGAAYASKALYLSMPELRGSAATSLRRAIALQPGSARAWRELGRCWSTWARTPRGWPPSAARWPSSGQRQRLRGDGRALFIGRARFAEAADWFARALERNPKGGWYARLAHSASLIRDFALGERAAQQAMELQESSLSGREGLFIAGAYARDHA